MLTLYALLALILAVVTFLPFIFKAVEERLEFFLLLAGLASVTASWSWSPGLLRRAALDPLPITLAVLAAATLFHFSARATERLVAALALRLGVKAVAFALVLALGLLSGLITALIAALVLAEAVALLGLDRKSQVRLSVLACFSIGLGAVLTPLGEPLATITLDRIQGGGHQAGFWFLFKLLGAWILPLILLLSAAAWLAVTPAARKAVAPAPRAEKFSGLVFRAFKVYLFVAGLELLGEGFNPATGDLLRRMPGWALYWASLVSAVLDNASLAAAGLSPQMTARQLTFFMLGLILSGGMMVPGNFPNIVCAGKLKITFREWAAVGIPAGMALMGAVFAVLALF